METRGENTPPPTHAHHGNFDSLRLAACILITTVTTRVTCWQTLIQSDLICRAGQPSLISTCPRYYFSRQITGCSQTYNQHKTACLTRRMMSFYVNGTAAVVAGACTTLHEPWHVYFSHKQAQISQAPDHGPALCSTLISSLCPMSRMHSSQHNPAQEAITHVSTIKQVTAFKLCFVEAEINLITRSPTLIM